MWTKKRLIALLFRYYSLSLWIHGVYPALCRIDATAAYRLDPGVNGLKKTIGWKRIRNLIWHGI